DVHQSAFLQVNKPHALRDDEAYHAVLEPADRALVAVEDQMLAQIAATLTEAAALLWPGVDDALARSANKGARRMPATARAAVVSMLPRLTTVLGTGAVMLYQRDGAADL